MAPEELQGDDQSSTGLGGDDPARREELAQEYFRVVAGRRDEEQ